MIRDLTPGDPLYCPGQLAPTDAYSYPRATYIGPGALPVVRINWRANEIVIRVGMGAPFDPEWDGRLLHRRSARLSEPRPLQRTKGLRVGLEAPHLAAGSRQAGTDAQASGAAL